MKFDLYRLVVATHNSGKAREFAKLFSPYNIEILSAADLNLSSPEETGATFAENALLKARAACGESGLPALADDSGLCVESIGGAPGIHAGRWAENPATGQRDFFYAMDKVRDKVPAGQKDQPLEAYFLAALALVLPTGEIVQVEGRCEGHLIPAPRGQNGHGYDPWFVPTGYEQTFGEIPPDIKNQISHRARAFATLGQALGLEG